MRLLPADDLVAAVAQALFDETLENRTAASRVDATLDGTGGAAGQCPGQGLSLIHISEPTRPVLVSRMPSSA